MIRIAHIIKQMDAPPGSEWAVAQPITLASMRAAQAFARDDVAVELYAVRGANENVIIPEGFHAARPLERDARSVGPQRVTRPLPLLKDVLDRLYETSDAEYFVYTNIDIALMPHFYVAVQSFIAKGHDAIVINRRTIPAAFSSPADLPAMYACIGTPHPGFDCFVFRRSLYPRFVLGDVCLGSGHVDLPLICSMIATYPSFLLVADEHLTFHLGDPRVWYRRKYRAERAHNDREASMALVALAKLSSRPLRWPYRMLLSLHLLKNSLFVREFRRMFS